MLPAQPPEQAPQQARLLRWWRYHGNRARALGHASATVTLNTYAHLWPTAEDRTRAAAAAMLAETLSAADHKRTSAQA